MTLGHGAQGGLFRLRGPRPSPVVSTLEIGGLLGTGQLFTACPPLAPRVRAPCTRGRHCTRHGCPTFRGPSPGPAQGRRRGNCWHPPPRTVLSRRALRPFRAGPWPAAPANRRRLPTGCWRLPTPILSADHQPQRQAHRAPRGEGDQPRGAARTGHRTQRRPVPFPATYFRLLLSNVFCTSTRLSSVKHSPLSFSKSLGNGSQDRRSARALHGTAMNTGRRHQTYGAPTPAPCVTFRRVVAPLRGPGQSPVLPFACCVGSLLSVGRCGRCSCWCRFRVRGAQWLV